MSRRSPSRHLVVWLVVLLTTATAGVWSVRNAGIAGATPAAILSGEGGDALGPVVQKLLRDDTAGLLPDSATYVNVDLDQGIADFVGSAPNTFGNDFAVTERALTTAEAATAKADGRSYAYVPFAATPIALMTLVPDASYPGGSAAIHPQDYCQHIPLSLSLLDEIYGSQSAGHWSDAGLSCTAPPAAATPPDGLSFLRYGNLDPTMENYNFMTLLDSTPASQAAFGAAFSTSDEPASEHWPYAGTGVTGGDQVTLGSLIGLDPRSNAPATSPVLLKLGSIMPVASDWTGDPLGVVWNLPTAAIQNAAGDFVAPSSAAAKAAEADATLASTNDPTTNNIVTFNASASDATAYNNYLMMESYLLVPTTGLSADKALALAQFIRFVVGGTGQADISALGAAPATAAMVTADLAVAQTLDAEAGSTSAAGTTSTTSTGTSGTGSGSASGSGSNPSSTATTVASSAAATGNTGTGSSAGNSGSGGGALAVTGSNPVPLLGLGLVFVVSGEVARRYVRRRRSTA